MGRPDPRQKKGGEMTRGKKKTMKRQDARQKKLGDMMRDKKNSETRHKTKKIETLDAR